MRNTKISEGSNMGFDLWTLVTKDFVNDIIPIRNKIGDVIV